ncbi:hypothetical protein AFIC_002559 [[Pseudomonas] carboxydohydrogena]|uniref:Uncharacterized protein n=1 Tax=Afipia carboxydohydrogena TaxID=290 RepID=A0ABY8BRF9_AFICR|nr:hypothetical protein [[Pseudomonas] carboxydohydrogena]WEF50997.1 hypothetical protein AFIC_002559 [[Pseudomonas] carboxydohydrogena]
MTELVIGAIVLTLEESHILRDIKLRQEELLGAHHLAHRNGELVLEIMGSLLKRNAIPEMRLRYFEDPAFRTGRIKGSHRALFERNKTIGDDIYRHPNFLIHLRYFLSGADLPSNVADTFSQKAKSYSHVGPSDALELGGLARDLSRKFGLLVDTEATAEEFYKLSLDCGIYHRHAAAIRDRVRSMK